ncbi:acetyl-CoA acetyltransferase [Xanthobacter autotrophicus]|uniref:acetyl-CoA acetyltransferase n=1 Tax=Xanthobacter TaxID=279 RepID=UPI0024ABB60E|nr:acetyl-CoA acetyltransferase [Xanthobacter autotrophicus]MDI4663934.1 acetyl-CoA acetyltransferase [Xanthobacter autotrophicus]
MLGHIIGWSHTRFGKLDGETLESLISGVASSALSHAGVLPAEVDEIVVGHFNQGLDPQGFPASLALQADPALRFRPSTRVENACATGSAAVRHGAMLIASGQARIVLVLGVEKMTASPAEDVRKALASASYVKQEGGENASFAGLFGQIASEYFRRHGDQSDALAYIAAKNHRNGAHNPLAHMQKDLGYEFCATISDKNPIVASPLRRTDCSMVSDGAAALVLARSDVAATRETAIGLKGMTQVNDYLPMSRRDMTRFEGAAKAWHEALEAANLNLLDLDFVETHDCFTIAELIEYEAMGLTPAGEGRRAILEGWTEPDGKLPVNLSGGLKAKGHPIGATGVSMHVMAAMQLAETAPGIQLRNARRGGIFNMGGAAVANYVSILERTR